jgi:hypothetical protein
MQFDRVKRREFITLLVRRGGVAARGARAAETANDRLLCGSGRDSLAGTELVK